MYLLGGTLTKLLAAAVAVMTVISGMPRVQCVCPDGRVKLFCAGSPSAGCCCAAPDINAGGGDQSSRKLACCVRAAQSRSAPLPGDGPALSAGACGCERTAVEATPQFAPEDDGGTVRSQAATILAWGLAPLVPEPAIRLTHVGPRADRHPPDLVVLFCHFTC